MPGARELVHAIRDVSRGQHGIVGRVRQQTPNVALDLVVVADVLRGDSHHLKQALGAGARDRQRVELRLLAGDAEQERRLGGFRSGE